MGYMFPPNMSFMSIFPVAYYQLCISSSPLIESFSIDEAFLNVTSCEKLFGSPIEIAHKRKNRIKEELNITCSIGIGPNKLLAKMAAELQKPDGLTVLKQEEVPNRIWPLPVKNLFGVSSRYEHHLKKLGIHTIGDLANFKVNILTKRFGVIGKILWQCANGIDYSPVDPFSLNYVKSIEHQVTLPRNYLGEDIKIVLWKIADQIAQRIRGKGYVRRTVVLTLRDTNLNFLIRTKTLPQFTNLAKEIFTGAMALLNTHWSPS
ncbi:MAG: polymerase [Clostridia bacterium]|nr:polymerase [Clostridia bacterium]